MINNKSKNKTKNNTNNNNYYNNNNKNNDNDNNKNIINNNKDWVSLPSGRFVNALKVDLQAGLLQVVSSDNRCRKVINDSIAITAYALCITFNGSATYTTSIS